MPLLVFDQQYCAILLLGRVNRGVLGLVRMVVSIRASVADNDNYLDKTTDDETFYIDINSEQLQEILRSFTRSQGNMP
jgi:hypothetical protein